MGRSLVLAMYTLFVRKSDRCNCGLRPRFISEVKSRAAIVAIGALALVWGYNWVVIKIATGDASPFAIIASSERSHSSSLRRSRAGR
jgi:hypothetical protein